MAKIGLVSLFLISTLGGLQSCAPNQDYIRQYQALHRNNPCVQCREIVVHSNCSSQWHSTEFDCSTPVINYGLDVRAQCGQATITCSPDPRKTTSQSVMIVALMESGVGDKPSFAPITNPTGGVATLKQTCGMESEWIRESMDHQKLTQPLTLQCAHNVENFVLPPVDRRYKPEESSTVEQKILNEDVEVQVVGTTLMPVVKERVVQTVVNETHHVPIEKKRIVKTKHISQPTVEEREVVERVPVTKIVPTFEERRATQLIHGTTVIPVVEEIEVTSLLPEVQPTVQSDDQPQRAFPAERPEFAHAEPSFSYERPEAATARPPVPAERPEIATARPLN
ncbi:hypothetical protein M3Y94_00862300 [Aphelenchoides besseyi]|nr:hypothetical protein M3Y94_00851000 [Aphelenchoides besseyi]KAI6206055.1 hypothetical protein M3Y94_00862300 [Aphelenchoides besseyi]KAI6226737.1 hypothetical protein M3Y95_00652300 [Aphelenchoides besseyi]KAI6226831.1 hypothetical protein M3Y95_00662500 [Aphelenchoides besseyi]